MIPGFKDYFYPCLLSISDGNLHTYAEIKHAISDYFSLSVEDLAEKTPSGKNRHADRCSWTVAYLRKAGLVTFESRFYKITELGLKTFEEKKEEFDLNVVRDMEDFSKSQSSASGYWVPPHYTSSGKYVAGYWSNHKYKGCRRRLSEEELIVKTDIGESI